MKLKHIIAVTVGAAALCAPSCDLDEKFYSEVTPDTFFTSPESTYAVLCRPFTHWKWYIGADRWYLQELTTDEMVCPKRGSDWYNSGEYYRLHYHTWSPDDRFVVNTYDGTTGGISRALEAKSDLQGVDYNAIGLNDAVKADHINQLNAITAYFYMRGLDYFGGMPIYYSVDDDLCARSTAREPRFFSFLRRLEMFTHTTLISASLSQPHTRSMMRSAERTTLGERKKAP